MNAKEVNLYISIIPLIGHYMQRRGNQNKALSLLLHGAAVVDCYVLCEKVESEFFAESALPLEEFLVNNDLRTKPIVLSPKVASTIFSMLSRMPTYSIGNNCTSASFSMTFEVPFYSGTSTGRFRYNPNNPFAKGGLE